MQYWCDSAISNTTNLPKNTTSQDLYDTFIYAWKSQLKGITIYVDGSRDGVLVDSNTTQIQPQLTNKRNKSLYCDIYESKSNGKNYIIIVGLNEKTNKPYEVFAYDKDKIENKLPRNGFIVKTKSKKYQLTDSQDNILIEDLATISGEVETIVLLLTSGLLRHGMGVVS